MSDEQLIAALQTAVKQEVMERYILERRIIEEEISIVLETASAYHGGLAAWDTAKVHLAAALIEEETARKFFAAAGLASLPWPASAPMEGYPRPKGLTRQRRYRALISLLYKGLAGSARDLEKERAKAFDLLEEVNQDIHRFEAQHDLLAIAAYLRSLDVNEIKRRKILGSNFTAAESLQGAAALSFKAVNPERLAMTPPEKLRPPREVMGSTHTLLQNLCRRHGMAVEALWTKKKN